MPTDLLRGGKIPAFATMFLVAVLILTSCSKVGGGTRPAGAEGIGLEPEGPEYEASLDPALMEGQNRFALNLYRELAGDDGGADGGEGVFVSPVSIALALSMTYNGARGETAEAMAEVLQLGNVSLHDVNASNYSLIKALAEAGELDSAPTLRIANGIWQREGHHFYEDFLERNRQFYGAKAESVDFTDPATADAINEWVSRQTEGRIEGLIEEVRSDSVMFLVNAIYFKGDWSTPFAPADTRPALFHRGGGESVEVPLMHLEDRFDHYRGDGFQAVRLPYGGSEGGGRVAMYVFVPDEEVGLEGFHRQLTYENWSRWFSGFEEKTGLVALPRFRVEYKARLNDPLKSLGMGIAFDRARADFGAMTPVGPGRNVYIGEVLHQTFLEVNERGSEAAGATSVEMRIESALLTDFALVADRPFFAAIVDDDTGAILFAGSVIDPKPAE